MPETLMPATLTPEGDARRRAMLDELTDAMRQTHDRRRRRRRVGAACGWGVLVTTTVLAARTQVPSGPERIAAVPHDEPEPVHIVIVETDPHILDRWAPAATFTATIIDDDVLLSTLSDLGRPTGLVQMGGRAYLTAAVTDQSNSSESDW